MAFTLGSLAISRIINELGTLKNGLRLMGTDESNQNHSLRKGTAVAFTGFGLKNCSEKVRSFISKRMLTAFAPSPYMSATTILGERP
jgi:hypothetical protein